MENIPITSQDPALDSLIRREAGEGWHPKGLNGILLLALVGREDAVDKIAENGGHQASPESTDRYDNYVALIADLKQLYGFSDPPPIIPPDSPGAVE